MSSNQPVELTLLMLLALLLLSSGVGRICCSIVPENSTDMLALLDFRAITNDPRGALSSWNTSSHHCAWMGVKCSLKHPERVTTLNLTGLGLLGPIASSVANLTFLHTLDLSNNHFSGDIPALNNLHKMQFLNLSFNTLGGIIPDTLINCSNLSTLDLSNNLLAGAIPWNIDFLSNLVHLHFGRNNLTGTIPPTLGNTSRLYYVNLGTNNLEGRIPVELGKLSNMSRLHLDTNSLSGETPQVIFNITSLERLTLELNMLGKILPPDIGDTLPNLEQLTLGANMFHGHIPASLGNASRLVKIGLENNNFSGQIPSSFGKLANLSALGLHTNELEARDSQSWDFLHALSNCSLLKKLSLENNRLHGVIPNSIGNLSINLEELLLSRNYLSGTVPQSIGNLRGLIELGLAGNELTGSIDNWIENLKGLQGLYLYKNNFIGPIPSFFDSFTNLNSLILSENKFQGLIPSNLGRLEQLIELYLSHNNLHGHIPKEVLSVPTMESCSLSYNNLEGSIPLDISKLQQLTELYLSSNKLTGDIPNSLGQCQQLQTIQMDLNFLTGSIPISFGNLKSLVMLNLSRNNLSGTIPTDLNGLPYLIKLDLSYNNLQGAIPRNGVFENATAVSLNGNMALCGGAMDLHMQSCPTVSHRAERRYYLIKVLIPIFGFISLILLVYFILLEKKMPRGQQLDLPYFGEHFPKVSYKDLAQATRNFSEANLVGRGSHGSVYRGKLKEPNMEVAIKVFDLEMQGADRSFMSECEALRSIQHRNLLPIITACSTVNNTGNVFKALVYDFMPNGNLDTWLHPRADEKAPNRLGLTQRISVAVNMADALDYLHHDCGRPTIHCDLKPSNILLDDDMNAVLGDFGIARLYVTSQLSTTRGSSSSVGVRGTIGYIAPEYAGGGHVSTYGDVYSFGVVLLEMITNKRPTDPMFKDGLDIINFVDSNFPHQIYHVIDAHLIEECDVFGQGKMATESAVHQCFVSLMQVALSCARPLPNERINMKQVASKMHAIQTSYLGWKAKK